MSSVPIRWVLPLSSVVIIAVGTLLAVAGNAMIGLIVAAFGAIDLATVPFVLRWIGRGTAEERANPYARED